MWGVIDQESASRNTNDPSRSRTPSEGKGKTGSDHCSSEIAAEGHPRMGAAFGASEPKQNSDKMSGVHREGRHTPPQLVLGAIPTLC